MKQSTEQLNPLYLAEVNEISAHQLIKKSKYDEAAALLKQALELKQKAISADAPQVAEIMVVLGYVYCQQKNYSAAEEILKQAQAKLEKAYYPEHANLIPVIEHLADCYLSQNNLEQAEICLKKVLEIHQKTSRADRLDMLAATRKLVHLYQKENKWTDAEALLKKAVTSANNSPWGPVEDFLYDQAITCCALNKDAEAEAAYKQAINAYRQRRSLNGLQQTMQGYAELLLKMGKANEAEEITSKTKQLAK